MRGGRGAGSGSPVVPARWQGSLPPPDVRNAEDLRIVMARPDCTCTGPAYYMYRDVARNEDDRQWMREEEIRFDVTVIPPGEFCGEYTKTLGHYHPRDPSGTGYPEIYEVLAGEAHYIIQAEDCSDVVMIAARAGEIVVVPPGYGHVTVNPSKRMVLEMANIVSSRFQSDYSAYVRRRGAAYYEMAGGTFRKNPHYPEKTNLRLVRAFSLRDPAAPLSDPLYDLIAERAGILGFLNRPEEYEPLLGSMYP